ncbi:MAG: FKBP-type peptidylprolyl isomerase [Bacteroidota bacterium]
MNKIHKLFLLLVVGILIVSCGKDDDQYIAPPRDYAVQYPVDLANIDKFLDEYYMEVSTDYDVTFAKIPSPNPDSRVSIRLQTAYPLQFKMVNRNEVDYKVYYISLREGVNERPSRVDSAYVSYKGTSLFIKKVPVVPATTPITYVETLTTAQFDYAQTPIWFKLEDVVPGWQEIIPLFKTGNYDSTPGPNPISFTNFGAGVMFLPSGLGYYNTSPNSNLPGYSSLIFTFKLNNQQFRDHDSDGILSKEEVDPLVVGQNPKDYDSDGDGFANMFDLDDDGDHYLTKNERKYVNPLNPGVSYFYPFTGAATDDPSTPFVDERQGIPNCSGDYTTSTRLRKHLDPSCH